MRSFTGEEIPKEFRSILRKTGSDPWTGGPYPTVSGSVVLPPGGGEVIAEVADRKGRVGYDAFRGEYTDLVKAGATTLAMGGGLYRVPDMAQEVAEMRRLASG